MSSTISINTAHNVTIDMATSSLGDRILAYLIDLLIKYGYLVLLGLISYAVERADGEIPIPIYFILLVPFVFYSLFFEIFNNGQTPGKKYMKLQVSTLTGHKVSTGQYFLRWIFRILDLMIMSGVVAILSIAISDKSQRIGDIVAGTTVISIKQRVYIKDTVFQKISKDYQVQYFTANMLSTKDVITIKEAINSKLIERNPALIRRLARKVSEVIGVELIDSSGLFLRTVLKDYNHLMREEESLS